MTYIEGGVESGAQLLVLWLHVEAKINFRPLHNLSVEDNGESNSQSLEAVVLLIMLVSNEEHSTVGIES